MWKKLSIHAQLTALLVVLLSAIQAGALSTIYWFDMKERQSMSLEQAATLGRALNQDLLKAILFPQADTFADISFRLSGFQSVDAVVVRNQQGQEVFSYQREGASNIPDLLKQPGAVPVFTDTHLFFTYHLKSDSSEFGAVKMAIELSSYQTRSKEHLLGLMMLFPVELVIGLSLAWWLGRHYSRPIRDLALAIRQSDVEASEFKRVETTAKNEIQVLYDGYNKMVDQIKTSTDEMREALRCKETADNANLAKSRFLANMSHEIRTPLTAIIGFSESMLDDKQSMPERVEAIHTVIRSGKHLLTIINDILDLSKIEAGKLEVESLEVSVFDILSDIQAIAQAQAEAKGLTFTIEYAYPLPDPITSDPVRLKQILLNLCSNAIKFTETGSVKLCVAYDKTANQMCFDVVDTGIGLTPEQQSRLFSAFSQADASTTRKYGGTGLGLHLSRQLAEKLGGTISLKSQAGAGSTFSLTIAAGARERLSFVNEEPEATAFCKITDTKALLAGTVLVADDNPDNRRLISIYIRKLGAAVDTAENGLVATQKALAGNYPLILMDMQMPVMDGHQATRTLREKGYTRAIVALTANAMQEDVTQCLDAGCDDFLSKPVDRERFNAILKIYLPAQAEASATQKLISSELLAEGHEFDDLIQTFVTRLPVTMQTIEQALGNLDWGKLKAQLHDMKGVSGNLGYPQLSRLCTRIELAIAKQDQADVSALLEEMNAMCEQIRLGAASTLIAPATVSSTG